MNNKRLWIRSLFLSVVAGLLFLVQPAQAQNQKYAALFYFPIFGNSFYHPVNISPSGDSWIMNGQTPPFSDTHFTPNFWGKPYWAATHGDGTIKNNYIMYRGTPATPNNELLDWHADLIAQAGVDFIVFDNTNGTLDYTPTGPEYVSCMQAVCNRWQWRMQQGLPTPKIVFFVMDEVNLGRVEDLFFSKYSPDLFFNYLGKKLLLVADPVGNDSDRGRTDIDPVPKHGKFINYTSRHCWALNNQGAFWNFKTNAVEPPPPFMYEEQPEQVCAPVSVGGWDRDRFLPGSQGRDGGRFFTKYMDHAKTSGAKIVFIHSWNEWVSPNLSNDNDKQTRPVFIDQYLEEYSSDIEPMAGGHGFQYYDLMKLKIADFKGTTASLQSPYAGVIPIPGIVEAENFDNGGESISYHDTTPLNLIGPFRPTTAVDTEPCSESGNNLAYSADGEWLEYTVNVASTGAYTFDARVSSPFATGRFHIEMDGVNVTGALAVPNTTGWQNWQTVSKTVNLTAGQHIMRFVIDAKEFNTNKFTFTAQGPIQTPFPGPTAAAIPGVVESENFDNGGEGVAYHDTEETNFGGEGSRLGPDVFTVSEGTNGIGWINNGEWLEYTVNVATAGSYTVDARVASVFATGVFHLEWDGVNISNAIAVPNTTNWQTWQSVTKTVTLTAGQHVLRVFADAGNFNINKLTFAPVATAGDGLTAQYFNGNNFQTPVLTRKDANINFNWGGGSPAPGVNVDSYSVRWTGQLLPRNTGTYTFHMTSDNGRRVWVNNVLIIDKWLDDWAIEYTGTINLTAGQRVDIKVEYFENVGGADAKLEWSGAGQTREVIPQSQLFSSAAARLASQERIRENVGITTSPALRVSPNPASDLVNLAWENAGTEAVSIIIVDMKGAIVYSSAATTDNSMQLQTGHFQSGIYAVHLKGNRMNATQKLMINR
ncbi:MAG: carbohydrate-binding protein [Bacteroidota bacterium]